MIINSIYVLKNILINCTYIFLRIAEKWELSKNLQNDTSNTDSKSGNFVFNFNYIEINLKLNYIFKWCGFEHIIQ